MKILIADDDASSRVYLERALSSQGHTVESAVNGVTALDMASQSPPDLIISDIMMPRMDGFELCRKLKSDGKLHTIPFVFYTATYVEPKDEKLAKTLGAARYLIKPLELPVLFSEIDGVISERRQNGDEPPSEPLPQMSELDRMQLEVLAAKLGKKVRELEKERAALRESERKVRELNVDLEIRVAERTAELRDSEKALVNLVEDLQMKTRELEDAYRRLGRYRE